MTERISSRWGWPLPLSNLPWLSWATTPSPKVILLGDFVMNLAASKLKFEQDGFLRVENLFNGGKLLELERELKEYDQSIVPTLPSGDIVYETDPATGQRTGIRNLWRMEKY